MPAAFFLIMGCNTIYIVLHLSFFVHYIGIRGERILRSPLFYTLLHCIAFFIHFQDNTGLTSCLTLFQNSLAQITHFAHILPYFVIWQNAVLILP